MKPQPLDRDRGGPAWPFLSCVSSAQESATTPPGQPPVRSPTHRHLRSPPFALSLKPSWQPSTGETPRRSRALWTEDGEYIDDSGRSFVGRDAIEKGYAEFFAGNPDAKIQITIDSLRPAEQATRPSKTGALVADSPPGGAAGSVSTRSFTSR